MNSWQVLTLDVALVAGAVTLGFTGHPFLAFLCLCALHFPAKEEASQ